MGKRVVLGGGCFWGMQELFRKQPGVLKTTAGYSGGSESDPIYESHRGHAEVIQIEYDDSRTSFKKLLDYFFQIHDPTTVNRQGNDVGDSYRSVIFYADADEKRNATDFIEIVNRSGRWENPVVTTLEQLDKFYPAEDYHQDYLQKYPGGYTCHFPRFGSYL